MLFLSRPNRRDRKLLTEFQQQCALHFLDHLACGPTKVPEQLLGYSAEVREFDPRPGLSTVIHKKLKDAGKTDLGHLGNKDAEPFIALAKSALLSDEDFQSFVQRLPSDVSQSSRAFREDWNSAIAKFERLKARMARFGELAPTYFKEKTIYLPEGDLLSFVKTLDTGGWHRFMCDCDWDEPEASDILPAASWIVSQPECDRWTAVAFLAAAQASAIDDGDRDHLDPVLAQKTMSSVSDKLRDGFYHKSEFAVIANAQGDVELARVGASTATEWRFPFHWDRVGDLGTIEPKSDIEFHRNRPVKSFEAWLSDSGYDI